MHKEVMETFTLRTIPNLDVCVLAALELFSQSKIPQVKIPYKRPLVVGSGNAAASGKIIFRDKDAVFADESNFQEKLKSIKAIDGVVLLSASGGKHAPLIAKAARSKKKQVTLITTNENALAREYAHKTYVFPKNREPYTYNTSTYMGMILSRTKEDPKKIMQFIKKRIDKLDFSIFANYKRFFLIVPEEFEGMIRLLNVKFIELFGRRISRDIETHEYMKHAVSVVPSNELFISFGKKNEKWGEHNFFVPLPKNADYVTMMAISYYVIGKIQAQQPAWFKKHISNYTKKVSKEFGQNISPIVE